jgi:hypothetical protein
MKTCIALHFSLVPGLVATIKCVGLESCNGNCKAGRAYFTIEKQIGPQSMILPKACCGSHEFGGQVTSV